MSAATLVVVASGERFPIEASVTIGRSECDIVLDDDLVSRRHATLRATPIGIEIEDLGSRNGTRVNGERIEQRHTLQENDIVEVGNVRLRVEGLAAVAVTRAAAVIQPTAAPPLAPRGDVPPPPPKPTPPPMRKPPPTPADAPPFHARAAGRRSGPSAARRSSATLVAVATIFGTAAALVAYFADRGL